MNETEHAGSSPAAVEEQRDPAGGGTGGLTVPHPHILMDDETLEALKGSIAKWRGVVAGTVDDQGTNNCPLCARFHPFEGGSGCLKGCPVAARTGRSGCLGSPYSDYDEAQESDPEENPGRHEQMQAAACAEVAFLISLLPPGESSE